ncbi:50S ribosomal protein L37ae [Candidatus Woesearchaeota archaeon]|jgi:large subunit ribosomal protein L37Ae|nr:50S ribosomal protein L37ae [Candidatus Woesearchaeota archaeon]MBT4387156.1 50S ribosomal protein L37ae [Candidatus Woesearchaeota archaeon]MBT4596087.1 50S ribosomal protein L37ae [Candidatus Woesearchaeota archaeon]MBT5741691.1 50S ribosomal protein L37ae [Candidatus Woesearchaeota archaeon]MBT6505452.1 50S ribosomal protein L37ae [Candidatus Woesearchaeota archaeon]
MAKKKTGISKTYGGRYGKTNLAKIDLLAKKRKESSKCPSCLSDTVKREALGIWVCKKCNTKFASRAFETSIN